MEEQQLITSHMQVSHGACSLFDCETQTRTVRPTNDKGPEFHFRRLLAASTRDELVGFCRQGLLCRKRKLRLKPINNQANIARLGSRRTRFYADGYERCAVLIP